MSYLQDFNVIELRVLFDVQYFACLVPGHGFAHESAHRRGSSLSKLALGVYYKVKSP